MRRAAVCIGVDNVVRLEPLRHAASGARSFAEWARGQGCDVRLFTDDDKNSKSEVGRREILAAIDELVSSRILDQIIVYFAGHGVLAAPGAEFWLLSDAGLDGTEAVNVLLTAEYARYAGIPQVVFISDACRTYVAGPPLTGIAGGLIFPPLEAFRNRPADIDIYFATGPGDPAGELTTRNQEGYGIFTECLLEYLLAPPLEIVDTLPRLDATRADEKAPAIRVITSRKLRDPLKKSVEDHASTVSIAHNQTPEIRVESDLPQYLATADEVTASSGIAIDRQTTAAFVKQQDGQGFEIRSDGVKASATLGADRTTNGSKLFDLTKLAIRSGYEMFEHRPNIGSHFAYVFVFGSDLDSIDVVGWEETSRDHENEGVLVELAFSGFGWATPTSAVLRFANGLGTVVPIVTSTCTMVVTDSLRVVAVDSLDVTAGPRPGQSRKLLEYEQQTKLARYSAQANDDARDGHFDLVLDQKRYESETSAYIPMISVPNPMVIRMEILRTYALREQGHDPLSYLDSRPWTHFYLPFDIYMVIAQHQRWGDRGPERRRFDPIDVAPFVPMMTRGWLLAEAAGPSYTSLLEKLRPHVIPSLWTTLDADGTGIAAKAIYDESVN